VMYITADGNAEMVHEVVTGLTQPKWRRRCC